MAEAIVAKNLFKRYGDFEAVKGISFRVKKGEAFALLGPNGAGKTTTVRMLTTLTSITSGEAYVNGFNVKSERLAVRLSIGLVPDVSNLYDELTVRDNLLFMAKLYGAPAGRVEELIREFELPAERKFGKLSTGFKRRVTIASALIHEPEILFLDEPTNGLDVRSAKAVRGLIRSLNRQGMTVFITTHNMVEAETIPQRIAIMKAGNIVAEGKRNELARLVGKSTIVRLSVEPLTSSLIKALERFKPTFDEGSLVFNVADIDAFLETLMALRKKLNFRVKSLCTELPGIEDVFVELTGGCPCRGCPL
ncbi:ABC transporter ATP-binding protein [Thermococcus sp.]